MNKLAIALAVSGTLALSIPTAASASMETEEAKMAAASAADTARMDMMDTFGPKVLKPGQYVGVTTISSGKPGKDTPTGIFNVLEKQPMYRSKKYDNAAMPFMQRIDTYGIALHAGRNPGEPASHGCVRLTNWDVRQLAAAVGTGAKVVFVGAERKSARSPPAA